MAISFSNLFENLSEEVHKMKFKYAHDDKKCETCRIKYKDCECCLEYTSVKDDLIEYKCLFFNKNYKNKFDENLINKLILAL